METTNVTPEDWEEQLIDYSTGVMDPQDAARFEVALEQCRSRVQLAANYARVVGVMGTAAPPVEPPPGHKARLMERVAATAQVQPAMSAERPALTLVTPQDFEAGTSSSAQPRSATRPWFWAAAAAAVAVLLLAVMSWLRLETIQGQPNIPEGFRTVTLAPTDEYTGVSAVVLYNPDSNEAWLVADGLEPLPDDLIYELWLIKPEGQGQAEVGGVFPATQEGTAVHRTEARSKLSDYAGFAVSVERKPGVQEREGPVVVVGLTQGQ